MPIPKSALGTVGEDEFFELVVVLGRGDFVCYPPRADFEGNDFLVRRRHRPAALAVQVKTRDYHDKMGNLTVAVEAEALPEGDPKLVVVFEYFTETAQFGRFAWAVPDSKYRELSTLTAGKYEATLSPKSGARDRWVDYRYNREDLPWVVGFYLDQLLAATRVELMGGPARRSRKR